MQTRRIEAGADGAVEVAQSEVPGHVILRLFSGDTVAGVSLRADEVGQVLAAIAELLPQGGRMALRDVSAVTKKPDDFPAPFVSKPTLAQLVRGARVEWQDSKGKVWTGWVGDFGVWRDIYNREAPPAARVSVESCRPGEMPMSMAMPDQVLVENVLRVSCAPDPSPKECWKCHQSGAEWNGGEYPCAVCSRPTVHDTAEASCGHCDAFTGTQAEVDAHARFCSLEKTGDIRRVSAGQWPYVPMTEHGRTFLESTLAIGLMTHTSRWWEKKENSSTKVRMSPEEVMRISAEGHDATRVK